MTHSFLQLSKALRCFSRRVQVGIDFGSQICKIAIAEPRGKHTRIHSVTRFSMPEGDPLASGFLRSQLMTWVREAGLPVQDFVCTLPAGCIEYKCIELPPHAPQEHSLQVQQCLREHRGSAEQTLACDYWVTSSPLNPQLFSVHITWTDPTFLNLLHAECRAAGLYCRVIDAHPFALARIATCSLPATSGGTLMIDLGATSGTLAWILHNQPHYIRRIRSLGMAPLMVELSNYYSLPHSELECLFHELGITSPHTNAASSLLLIPPVQNWLQTVQVEITRTLSYLKQRGESTGQESIVLCGGGSVLRGIADWLSIHLSSEVRLAEVPASWNWDAPIPYNPSYSAAIALATLGDEA